MSYAQAIKWQRKHPKGTRQPLLMSTRSGFWPSESWLKYDYAPYVSACHAINIEPIDQETFYRTISTNRAHIPRPPALYALWTQAGTITTGGAIVA